MDAHNGEPQQNWESLGRERLALERERLAFDRARDQRDSRFRHKHFPTLLSAITTVFVVGAATIVSVSQFRLTAKLGETQERQKKDELALVRRQQDLDLAKFLIANEKIINRGTRQQRAWLANVMAGAFPPDIVRLALTRIEVSSPNKLAQQQWREIREQIVPKLPQESLHFETSATAQVTPAQPPPENRNQALGPLKADCAGWAADLSRPPSQLHRSCVVTGTGFGNDKGRVYFRVGVVSETNPDVCVNYSGPMEWKTNIFWRDTSIDLAPHPGMYYQAAAKVREMLNIVPGTKVFTGCLQFQIETPDGRKSDWAMGPRIYSPLDARW